MKWSIISTVSSESVLRSCLLKSPDIQSTTEVILQVGYSSAAAAYNSGIEKASTDLLVFVHQDVYLPEGWIDAVQETLELLSVQDPHWGVVGLWGATASGPFAGYLYWTGGGGGADLKPFEGVIEVRSLDEVVLIFKKSSGLRFDERLPGFHMYGADICLEARRRGMKCYAISAFCVHNTNGYDFLPFEFWQAYLFLRRKWKTELPITTTCAEITCWCWPMIRWNVVRAANLLLGREKRAKRVQDPSELYRKLFRHNLVQGASSSSAGRYSPHRPFTDKQA
jgi:glycosyltransferase involved in cell wall biosynthesis